MLPTSALTSSQPAMVRGLYAYYVDKICCEQAQASLYHGRRKVDELPVLIRLLRGPAAPDARAEWLERDYRIAQDLGSPCAAKPLAFERTDWGPALIYADEGVRPLEEMIATGALDVEAALTVGAAVAEAVASLHKERVIHCNLNPVTIWLHREGGGALISDFACARHPSQDRAQGAPSYDDLIDVRYMAPEQSGRLESIVDQRTDIYSLGIILFRLLTGRVPFEDPDPLHIIDGHVARQPVFPAELLGTLPAGLVKVVLKTLAKSPEARYLSARGLAADLLECRSRWRSTGTLAEFEPGHYDAKAMLRVSRQLYGREGETATLSSKAKSAKDGKPGMLLIKGAPGVGKSTLLGQLEGLVRKENGRFVSGKFDQYKRNVPYLALIQALQQLIGQLLSGTKAELEAWRSRILAAVGNNAKVVIDVVPELELITGAQPPVPDLPPVQTRNRFNHVFASLIHALAPRDQLLCLVMDDLQWVDAASLALLSHVLTDAETKNILFVGAYRDNEVDPTHPLETAVLALQDANVDVTAIHLGALKEADVLQLVRDTYSATATEARDLAQILHAKSGGNALYLSQFLPYLCDEGLIAFDFGSGTWVWDLARIQQEGVTKDVLDLLNLRLKALHEETRTILATAACIGSSFEADKVAVAAQRSVSEVFQCMKMATKGGLIVTIDDRELWSDSDRPLQPQTTGFRFLHDRVQEAAFDCITEEAKKDFRLQIGRRLLAGLMRDDEHALPPYVLGNLNSAWQLITDEEERQRVAQLNLAAGRKARRALAYQDALGFISVGLGLLGPRSWKTRYDLAFELKSEAFECEYLTGSFERAEQLFRDLIAHARTKLDTARVYRTKILLDTSEKRYEEAIRVGIKALRLFGIHYPKRPSKLHLLAELMAVRLRMRARKPRDLLTAKALNDPEKMAALQMLVALAPPAFLVGRDLLILTGAKIVNYSLRHGIAPPSAVGFVLYGFALGAAMDDFKRGYEFGHLAVELAEKSNDPATLCKVLYLFILIKVWRDPRDEVYPLVERVRKLALEVGEHQFVKFAITSIVGPRIMSRGDNLQEVLRLCEEHRPFIEQSKDPGMAEWFTIIKNCALALQGKTPLPYSLNDGAYDEGDAELQYLRTGAHLQAFAQYQIRLQLACLFDRTEEARSLSDRLNAIVRSGAGSGLSQVADFYLYRGLVAAMALSAARGRDRRQHRKSLRHSLARLRIFAASNPHGFGQHQALLEAEMASLAGEMTTALKHYNRAIDLAEAGNLTPLVGLASERAALLCLAQNQRLLAGWYLTCARTAYAEKWGATAKVAWLDRKYGDLLARAIPPASPAAQQQAASNLKSPPARHQGESFDVAAALQASRIIATGESGDRILTHLMQVIRVQTGAEAAHMLVLEGGTLRLEASATIDSGGLVLFSSGSTDAGQKPFSPAIVNFVLHSGQDLVLAEADADARFAECSYVSNRRPKSVLCILLRHRGETLGVIYLEHSAIADAFTAQKVEWLHLLATEVGLTVWTARLSRYRDYVHKFAPANVAREIDANPVSPNLEARDCDVSILFGDLAGYTRISEHMDRRQLDALMNRILSKFVDEVHRYEGTLIEIRGDELFVLFADDDPCRHVWKAASAALAISRVATGMQEELSGAQLPIVVNMGINSGVTSVGLKAVDASSGSRWRYGASGTVVNVAARVRERARDGSILMSADAVARVQSDFAFEDTGEHSLKNVVKPVRIYRLLTRCNP